MAGQPRNRRVRRRLGRRRPRRRFGAVPSRAATWGARSGSSGRSRTRATSTPSTTACRRSRATGCHLRALPKHLAKRLMRRDRGGRHPGRHPPRRRPDQPRRRARLRRARPGDARGTRDGAVHAQRGLDSPSRPRPARALRSPSCVLAPSRRRAGEGAPPADDRRARSASTARSSARSGRAWSSCSASGPPTRRRRADALARQVAELRIFRDDDGPDESLAARGRRGRPRRLASSRSTRTRAEDAGPGFTGAAPPELAEQLYQRFAAALEALGVAVATGPLRRGDGGRARERRPVHDLARQRRPLTRA